MRLALAQINTTVGDLDGNRDRIVQRIAEARDAGTELVVFPELAITGYPPEDLLLRPAFVRAAADAARQVAQTARGIVALVGSPHAADGRLYNACLVCADGNVRAVYRKRLLPNYGVFDEKRYFEPGTGVELLEQRRNDARTDGLRGPLATRPARRREHPGRRGSPRQPLRIALPRRQGRGARGDVRGAGQGQRLPARLLQRRGRPGRARLRRELVRPRRRGPGRSQSPRLRGGSARRRPRRAAGGQAGGAARRARPDAARPRAGPPRLRGEERLRRRRGRHLRRRRLGAHRRARCRGARTGSGPLRVDALSLQLGCDAQ